MRSKKRGLLAVVISATIILITPLEVFAVSLPRLSAAKIDLQSNLDIHVNPINDLRPDFIMGGDVSMLSQLEDSGGKFYVDGVEKDCLTILKDHGVNWIRLRI